MTGFDVKEILRWLAIALFGGLALFLSIGLSYEIITHLPIDWIMALVLAFVILIISQFYRVAYICFRRQYRQLFKVAGVIGAIVVFGEIQSLLRRWHLELHPIEPSDSLLAALGHLFVDLLITLGPLFVAAWLYRFCDRLAKPPPRTPAQLSHSNL